VVDVLYDSNGVPALAKAVLKVRMTNLCEATGELYDAYEVHFRVDNALSASIGALCDPCAELCDANAALDERAGAYDDTMETPEEVMKTGNGITALASDALLIVVFMTNTS